MAYHYYIVRGKDTVNRMVEVDDVDHVGDMFCYTPFGATKRFILNKDGKTRK